MSSEHTKSLLGEEDSISRGNASAHPLLTRILFMYRLLRLRQVSAAWHLNLTHIYIFFPQCSGGLLCCPHISESVACQSSLFVIIF